MEGSAVDPTSRRLQMVHVVQPQHSSCWHDDLVGSHRQRSNSLEAYLRCPCGDADLIGRHQVQMQIQRTPLGIAVNSLVIALPPGSFMVDVDYEKQVMLIHVLDASDPDAVREGFQEFYRRYQRHVFS